LEDEERKRIVAISEKNVFLPLQSGEGFRLQNPEREAGVSPAQYPLL
jgi:hypothetical protein